MADAVDANCRVILVGNSLYGGRLPYKKFRLNFIICWAYEARLLFKLMLRIHYHLKLERWHHRVLLWSRRFTQSFRNRCAQRLKRLPEDT